MSNGSKSFISKSRFKMAVECPTKPHFSIRSEYGNKSAEDDFLRALARGGFQVGELARWYIPGGVHIKTLDYQVALKETEKALEQEKAIVYEAAIKHENLFIRVDILVKDGDHLQLYEVKAKSFSGDKEECYKSEKNRKEHDFLDGDWKEYFYDVAFQDYVVKQALPKYKLTSYLYLIDKSKPATVDGLNQRFLIRDVDGQITVVPDKNLKPADLGEHILTPVNVTEDVRSIQTHPEFWSLNGNTFSFVEGLRILSTRHANGEKTKPQPTRECKKCEYRLISPSDRQLGKSGFNECWSEILPKKSNPEESLSIDLWSLHYATADKFFENKIYLMSQVSETDIPAPKKASTREKYQDGWEDYMRRRVQLRKTNSNDKTREFLKEPLQSVIKSWEFPLHFIDFETTRVAIPFFKEMRPYEQIAFQFSHHMVHADGTVEHKNDWINTERGKFPNFDFLRALKLSLSPASGTIFRYAIHENSVLCDIIKQLEVSNEPDRDELISWAKTITYKKEYPSSPTFLWKGEREMVDLLEVVKRYYYHPLMGNSNSIKAVLPAILHDSAFLQKKYSFPIYGVSGGIPSKNFTELDWNHTWVTLNTENQVVDPYSVLKKLSGTIGCYDYDMLERIYSDDEIADGGAAMTAYAMMQFTQMGDSERQSLTNALLRYCELDTLAMVMLYEYWCEIVGLSERFRRTASG